MVDPLNFQTQLNGKKIELFHLINGTGLSCQVCNYGARLISLNAPDRHGKVVDLVLGYESLQEYIMHPEQYFGATIGRYANRISGGRIKIHDEEFQLTTNWNGHQIHGGNKGFNKAVWDVVGHSQNEVKMRHASPDGEEGFPGNLLIDLSYRLSEQNELHISFEASSDRDTHFNCTNHSYFNLSGEGSGLIGDHVLKLNSTEFTAIDESQLPTGEILSVRNSPFDFTSARAIQDSYASQNAQFLRGNGYDHNFVIEGEGLRFAAEMHDPKSGRTMKVFATEPGIQFYGGNSLDAGIKGKGGKTYGPRSAFCLETQHFPDSPNQPSFPSTLLSAQKPYRSETIFQFSVSS